MQKTNQKTRPDIPACGFLRYSKYSARNKTRFAQTVVTLISEYFSVSQRNVRGLINNLSECMALLVDLFILADPVLLLERETLHLELQAFVLDRQHIH